MAMREYMDKLRYEPIGQGGVNNDVGDEQGDLKSSHKLEYSPSTVARTTWLSFQSAKIQSIYFLALSVICLIGSMILYRESFILYEKYSSQYPLLRSTVYYSPLSETDISFEVQRFTSAPLSSTKESIYRQPPGPEVDAAWDRLADIGTHTISSDDVLRLGKDPSKTVRVPDSWGHGTDAHIATLDGIHLVHCLNSMRKSLHINFDYYHKQPLGPEYVPHLTHCVEAVLQHLMCKPSMELLTHNWIERQHEPFPDFAINKKCWDYEAILAWKEQHRVRDIEKRFDELRPPNGTVPEPLPPLVAETWDVIQARLNESSAP